MKAPNLKTRLKALSVPYSHCLERGELEDAWGFMELFRSLGF